MSALVIYCRRSTDRQDLTHAAQEAAGRAWAKSHGYEVAGVFTDTCSGSISPLERKGFIDATDALGEGDILWVQRRDRLGRDVVANAFAQKFVEKHGSRVVSADCGSQVGPEQELLANLLDSFASYEKSLISARTRRALASRASQGLSVGTAPLGTTADESGKIIPNEEEAMSLEKVREWYRDGVSVDVILERCEAEGITARSGATPSKKTIYKWVKGVTRLVAAPRRTYENKGGRPPVATSTPGLVELLLRLRSEGKSFVACAAHLEASGFRNSRGNPFSERQLRRVVNSLARVGGETVGTMR